MCWRGRLKTWQHTEHVYLLCSTIRREGIQCLSCYTEVMEGIRLHIQTLKSIFNFKQNRKTWQKQIVFRNDSNCRTSSSVLGRILAIQVDVSMMHSVVIVTQMYAGCLTRVVQHCFGSIPAKSVYSNNNNYCGWRTLYHSAKGQKIKTIYLV